MLLAYYKEVKNNFENNFEEIVRKYPPFNDVKIEALKQEIGNVNTIISKLAKEFAVVFHKSLSGYAEHVRKANNNVMMNFVFPIPIKGLTY